MRRVFHTVLVLIVTLALVASATAWRQCTGLQLAAAISVERSPSATGHRENRGAAHGEHDHHTMHAQHGTANPSPPATDDHGCMKCCSMCTAANAVVPAANATMIFTVIAHVFSRDHKAWFGNTVAVDPGIPKRVV
jgi:hypothetical protein